MRNFRKTFAAQKFKKTQVATFLLTRGAYKQPRHAAMRWGIFIYLWFSRQRRASISCEVRRYRLQLVVRVLAVQVAVLAVRQDADQDAVEVGVIHSRDWKLTLISNFINLSRASLISITSVNFMHHLPVLEVFEDGHIEPEILQGVREILAVDVCSSPARKDKERRRE